MARQGGLYKFIGRQGDHVGFRGKNGDYYIRKFTPIPIEIWKNGPNYEPNRITARNFGDDSNLATYMRHSLQEYLQLFSDLRLHNRLMRKFGEARKFCMTADPKAPLDIRKLAPAFRHFSLRKELTLKEVAREFPVWRTDEDGLLILQLPEIACKGYLWRKVAAEYIRWHIAFVPLPVPGIDMSTQEVQKIQTEWMPIKNIESWDIPVEIPDANEGRPPFLIALGLEVAQGNGMTFYPLRSLSVMEILEII